jgi:DNA-binding MarR family transcriptional regulator
MASRKKPNPSIDELTDELLLAVGQLVRRARSASNTRELTWSQTTALARLEKSGPATTADLARAEAVKPQSMGATLAAMEEEGLVERTPHPTDGRQFLFGLTKDGIETRKKARAAKHDWLAASIAKLDESERRAVFDAIGVMRDLGES